VTVILAGDASLRSTSPREVGGKAWNLLRLRRHGFRVPPFWILPRDAFDAAGIIGGAARRVPPALGSELIAALPEGRLFAVRSSAVGEDSRLHSFAGVLDSILNVPRAEVPEAVERVWASALSARALLYRQRKGLTVEQTATAVIVQEMVQPVCAGVLFTRDPADGARRIVVSAGLGLGQGVVSDAVETDTYRMGWDDDLVSSDVRVKRSRVVLADPRRGGTREEEVHDSGEPALRAPQVRQLRDLGRDVEQALQGPQDVEWAYDAGERLVVLQARPIVGGSRSGAGPRRIWDNANVVESYPGLTLPLTFSFASRSYRRAFARAAESFLGRRARPSPHVYESLIGLIDGRVYYNLLAWYEMFSYLPGADRYRESWDRLIGVTERATPPPAPAASWMARAGTLAASLAILIRVKSLRPRFFARFDALRGRFQGVGSSEATAEEVVTIFRELEEDAASFWHLTLHNDFCALKYHQWLALLLERWCPGADQGVLNALLAGHETVESVDPLRSLIALVEAVRVDDAGRELFRGEDDRMIWDAVDGDPRWHALRDAFRKHIAAFGDRSVGELKLETVTFEEDPPRLVGLVKHYLSLGLAATDLESRRAKSTLAGEPGFHPVRGQFQRLVFARVLDRARAAVRAREDMRLARTRLFGMVRRLFRRLGKLLAEEGLLEAPRDVHYLTVGELIDFVRATGVTRDITDLVTLRKAEYARFAKAAAPPRMETTGIPRSNPLRAPETVREPTALLKGTGCSAGIASGRATVVLDPQRAVAGRDSILVAATTDPGWIFLMMSAAGIVVERGSLLSHTAIIGRELGIPTVVGAAGATTLIPQGAALRIDGSTGDVRWAS
jgi:phosphohistidine swiveling domain-containing protein